jgi:hypothetical protein
MNTDDYLYTSISSPGAPEVRLVEMVENDQLPGIPPLTSQEKELVLSLFRNRKLRQAKIMIEGTGILALDCHFPSGDPWECSYRISWTQAHDNYDPGKPIVIAYRLTPDGELVKS